MVRTEEKERKEEDLIILGGYTYTFKSTSRIWNPKKSNQFQFL
jgi:hypothetical protein